MVSRLSEAGFPIQDQSVNEQAAHLNPASTSHLLALLCPRLIVPPFGTPSLALNCGLVHGTASVLPTPQALSYISLTPSGHSIDFPCITWDFAGLYGTRTYTRPPSRIFNLVFPTVSCLFEPMVHTMAARSSLKSFLAALMEKKWPEPRKCGLTFKKDQRVRGLGACPEKSDGG